VYNFCAVRKIVCFQVEILDTVQKGSALLLKQKKHWHIQHAGPNKVKDVASFIWRDADRLREYKTIGLIESKINQARIQIH
jgi:hypothetical protein